VILDSTIRNNSGPVEGGGLFLSWGPATLERVTIAMNSTAPTAHDTRGGGIAQRWGDVDISDSAIIENATAGAGVARLGGGIYQADGTLTMTSSTVSGNVATNGTGGLFLNDVATIIASTIAGNTGGSSSALHPGIQDELWIGGSIISGSGDDCYEGIQSLGFNISSDSSCGLTSTGDVQSAALLLGPLADNGGPTFTHLPGVGSPARDAIPIGTVGLCDGTVATDQRGIARPQGAACDRGAVEQ
jgi:hypothetical protein